MATPSLATGRRAFIGVAFSTNAVSQSTRRAKRKPQLCLLGAPGSGKGSYGKILAQHWGIPLITVSDVLKKYQTMADTNNADTNSSNMSSGKLVDDDFVSEALLHHFAEVESQSTQNDTTHNNGTKGYILDGFPRTIQQVQLMQKTWPESLHIQAAVHLNVPAAVCEQKLLGRRFCTVCGNHYNVNGVLMDGFDLPPKLPRPDGSDCHRMLHQLGVTHASLPHQHTLASAKQMIRPPTQTTLRSSTGFDDKHRSCNPESAQHWQQREDDQPDIIHRRLEVYTQHTEPILEHFQQQETLFQFVPYKGFDDMPKFQTQLEEWVQQKFPEATTL